MFNLKENIIEYLKQKKSYILRSKIYLSLKIKKVINLIF